MDLYAPLPGQRRSEVLLLEDDHSVRRSLQLLLHGRGFAVRAFSSPETLLADPSITRNACLLVDYRLGDADGIAVVEALREKGWAGPAVLITAFGSAELALRASRAGFSDVLEKPCKDHTLVAALTRAAG